MVGIIMGSQSDLPIMQQSADFLKSLEIPYELTKKDIYVKAYI